jgi:drug/metabolite transporter (DMT)-like permease
VTFRKYLVLAGVTVFAAAGDSMLKLGMKEAGAISLHHPLGLVLAVLNPWVAGGIVLLLAFFASYTNALSWADLTYVLPATSLGYVLLPLIARFVLHEHVSPLRWLGIALISGGVGFIAGGPALTTHHERGEVALEPIATGAARSPLLAKDASNGAPGKEASHTPDYCVAESATHRAARPDPSAPKAGASG